MKERFLFGVRHKTLDEVSVVLAKLEQIKAMVIGLELPTDHVERSRIGVKDNFFSVVYEKTRARVVALESPGLYNRQQELDIARKVHENKIDLSKVITEYEYYKNFQPEYKPPEIVKIHEFFCNRYKNVLRLIDLGKDKVVQEWYDNNVKREDFMLKQILKHTPDAVVVGNAHALALEERLKMYKYVALT